MAANNYLKTVPSFSVIESCHASEANLLALLTKTRIWSGKQSKDSKVAAH